MLQSKVKSWKRLETGDYELPEEGITLHQKDLTDICNFYGIPATLLNIDKKYHTNTFHDVAKSVIEEVSINTIPEAGAVQVLDPKSNYVEDEKFYEIMDLFQVPESDRDEKDNGFSKQFTITLPQNDSDSFIGDLYKRRINVERLPQGGISLNTSLLRLVCTNGMLTKDAQYYSLIRSGNVSDAIAQVFVDKVNNFNVGEYLKTLFYHNGKPVIATVADYLGMRDTLKAITDLESEALDAYYPVEPIEEFYSSQNIDITKLNRNLLGRLPSGIDYHSCFNILTNGAKLAERNLLNEMKVADWARNTKMTAIQASDLIFHGAPQFSQSAIKQRMGDIK